MTNQGSRDWRDSEEGNQRVRRVLQKSGVPLETRALGIVRKFCDDHKGDQLKAVDLGPTVWRETEDAAFREVDAMAFLHETLSYGHVLVRFIAYFLLEAKYREDVEWFAFDSPHRAMLPADSDSAFSSIVRETYKSSARVLSISRLAALQTGNGSGGNLNTFKEEQVAQKAASALANFTIHLAAQRTDSDIFDVPVAQRTSLRSQFKAYLTKGGDWREALVAFLEDLSPDDHQKFLNERRGPHPLTVRIFVPIMVVNGRLNHVEMDDQAVIKDIKPAEFTVTGERLQGWPPREPFISRSAEFPMFVAAPDGLPQVLQAGYDYALNVRNNFAQKMTSGELNAVALESAIPPLLSNDIKAFLNDAAY